LTNLPGNTVDEYVYIDGGKRIAKAKIQVRPPDRQRDPDHPVARIAHHRRPHPRVDRKTRLASKAASTIR
jgi:hypothetical protein